MSVILLESKDKLTIQSQAWAIYESHVFPVTVKDVMHENDMACVSFADTPGVHEIPKRDIFLSKETAELALRNRENKKLNEYLSVIQTQTDLLMFPLKHNLTGPAIDYPARMAYETKLSRYLAGQDL